MYRVFKGIPRQVRQEAFNFLMQHNYGRFGYEKATHPYHKALRHLALVKVHFDGNKHWELGADDQCWNLNCCPLGALNYVVGLRDGMEILGKTRVSLNEILMPTNAFFEEFLLHGTPYTVDTADADRFMAANDQDRFDTPEKLARAMGAKYQPQQPSNA